MKRRAFLGSALMASMPLGAAEPDGLAALGARCGVQIGGMAALPFLRETPDLLGLLARETSLVAPGWELTWEVVEPEPGRLDFSRAEQVMAQLARVGLPARGHCLVWHEALPHSFDPGPDTASARQVVQSHISAVCGHFVGRMQSWVVVNEPLYPEHREPGLLRRTPFYRALGPDYIAHCLRWAAAADPHALLLINEYGLEMDTPDAQRRRSAMFGLLERLVRQGVPLHGLGIQGHLRAGADRVATRALQDFIHDVQGLGLEVQITELDVIDRALPGDIATRDRAVADMLRGFLDAVLPMQAVTMISTWGLDDGHSWMNDNQYTRRTDGQRARGHLYDEQLRPKPAREAFAAALRNAPPRERRRSAG